MGSWGIKAHESDFGLDLLVVVEDRILRGVKFKTFHIKHVTELLRSHIINEFSKESYGWETEYIDFFYDYTFPMRFAYAVMLVAECFAEYRQNGNYLFHDCEADKNRKITEFIYTDDDLETQFAELQSILDPKHGLYESWKDSDSFNNWQSHVRALCETTSQAISKGGDSHA